MNKKYALIGAVVVIIITAIGISRAIGNNNTRHSNQVQESIVMNENAKKLPNPAIEFIKSKYPGYAIEKVSDDPLCEGGNAFDVLLTKINGPDATLIFDDKGNYVQFEEELKFDNLPALVKSAVSSNFRIYEPAEDAEKLILANKNVQYQVDLAKDTTGIEAIFSETGELICKKMETIADENIEDANEENSKQETTIITPKKTSTAPVQVVNNKPVVQEVTQTKISSDQAKKIAEDAVGKTATKVSLLAEDDVEIYKVIIGDKEVKIDPSTGKIIAIETETSSGEED